MTAEPESAPDSTAVRVAPWRALHLEVDDRAAGFSAVRHVGPDDLTQRYFAGGTDELRPPTAEQLVVATV